MSLDQEESSSEEDSEAHIKAMVRKLVSNRSNNTTSTLSGSTLSSSGGVLLGEALSRVSVLRTLKLYQNDLDDSVAKAIAKGLSHNAFLTELDLDCNRITDAGCHALADMLTCNAKLCVLLLGSNLIENEGAASLAFALADNSTLAHLSLSYNHGISEFPFESELNLTLVELDIQGCSFRDSIKRRVDVWLESNVRRSARLFLSDSDGLAALCAKGVSPSHSFIISRGFLAEKGCNVRALTYVINHCPGASRWIRPLKGVNPKCHRLLYACGGSVFGAPLSLDNPSPKNIITICLIMRKRADNVWKNVSRYIMRDVLLPMLRLPPFMDMEG